MANEEIHINPPELSDWIKACLDQNPLAQRRLYEYFYPYVKSICLRYTSKIEDCEEVMDDSFIKVFKNLDKYDFERPFKFWVRTVTVNTAIDFYRQSIRGIQSNPIEDYTNLSLEDHTIERMSVNEIMIVIQKLSPSYRTVFMMFAIDGYSHKEIGELLNISEGTSKSNLSKARLKLQEMLSKEYKHYSNESLIHLTLPSNI